MQAGLVKNGKTTTADVFGYLSRELADAHQLMLEGQIHWRVYTQIERIAFETVAQLRLETADVS